MKPKPTFPGTSSELEDLQETPTSLANRTHSALSLQVAVLCRYYPKRPSIPQHLRTIGRCNLALAINILKAIVIEDSEQDLTWSSSEHDLCYDMRKSTLTFTLKLTTRTSSHGTSFENAAVHQIQPEVLGSR
eukprot:1599589-Amphidinium_carterae.1